MKRYERYKSSNISWVEEIPLHWEISKMRNLGFFSSSGIDKKINDNEQLVKIVNYTDVYGNKSLTLNSNLDYMTVSCPVEKIETHKLIKGDLIFTPSSETIEDIGVSALVIENLENTSYSYHLIRFRFEKEFDLSFRKYLCNNYFVLNQFSLNARGTTRQTLNRDNFNNIFVLVPPQNEQIAIAAYLDDKTKKIDDLIEKKEKLIELLKEERTAFINQTVTKGLNSKVKLKSSGIDWIGEIPEHWELKKLKHLVRKIGSGVTPKGGAEIYLTEGIPLIRSQNVYFDGLRLDDVAYISEEIDNTMIGSRVFEGDVLLNITGGSIGRCYFVPKGFGRANVNQHVCIIRPSENILTEYLYFLISSNLGQEQINMLQTGANREGLNFEQLKSFSFPIPNIKIQEELIKELKAKTSNSDSVINKTEKEIELLKEYRLTLINEVVTGKIKVV